MSVALFLPALGGGGAERVMVELAGGFAERGHRTFLVVNHRRGALADAVPAGVEVVELRGRGASGALRPLIRWLRRERPQALLAAMTHANVVALLACGLARTETRCVVSEHNAIAERMRRAKGVRQRVQFQLARRLYGRAHAVVGVSRGVGEDLRGALRLPADRVRVVHNPVVSARVVEAAEAPLDHPWVAAGAPPVVLGVGRLSAQKGFDLLLRAFAVVRGERSARLVILGEGEERPRLEALAAELGVADDVMLPGFDANPHRWMRHAAVFALSSRWEGFGIVVAEALAAGCPVASFDCPHGPAEILEDGRWGELVPVEDTPGLARAIAAQLDRGRDPAGDDARRARAAAFSRDAAVDRYLDLLLSSSSP